MMTKEKKNNPWQKEAKLYVGTKPSSARLSKKTGRVGVADYFGRWD